MNDDQIVSIGTDNFFSVFIDTLKTNSSATLPTAKFDLSLQYGECLRTTHSFLSVLKRNNNIVQNIGDVF